MRFLILNTDYPGFLNWLYAREPGLEARPYAEQMAARAASLFGVADFYSRNLRALGHEAEDVHVNNQAMQAAWARENGVRFRAGFSWRFRFHGRPPWFTVSRSPAWTYEVLAEQIRRYKPDVLLNQAMDSIHTHFLAEVKRHVRLVVGQIASPIPRRQDWGVYDLVVSSLPNYVEFFRQAGVACELNRLAFEPKVLEQLGRHERDIPFSFVGSISPNHRGRLERLERLCTDTPMCVWGEGSGQLPVGSAVRERHRGPVWGVDMYRVLMRSRLTFNHHIGIAGPYANNMRLFEATGSGCLLITDHKVNLRDMFEPGTEVVTYSNGQDCAELVRYYLEHDRERQAIAEAGQKRTLRDHTYARRVAELAEIVGKRLAN